VKGLPDIGTQPRVAVFRALQLGDMLCAVPALRALRAAWPKAHVTLIGLPWARAFVARYASLIDDLIIFPGAVGFPEQEESDAGLPGFYEQARARRFDLALQMHGSGGVANDILMRLGARCSAGFRNALDGPERQREGRFMPWPEEMPEPRRYTALLTFLGMTLEDEGLWFPLEDDDHLECDHIAAAFRIECGKAVIVHAGSQLPSRRWPAQRFAAVADALAARGSQVLLTGVASETPLARTVAAMMRQRAVNLAGATTLGGLAALVASVRLVVCNDTGISHIAAALGTPSVVVACGSDTRRWAPLDRERHRVIADYPACRPCAWRECPVDHVCAHNIHPDQVIEAAMAQLGGWSEPGAWKGAPDAQAMVDMAAKPRQPLALGA
jgi:ADP-heptose:LPS heptosyltransferase